MAVKDPKAWVKNVERLYLHGGREDALRQPGDDAGAGAHPPEGMVRFA
jgi:hypothetical protein